MAKSGKIYHEFDPRPEHQYHSANQSIQKFKSTGDARSLQALFQAYFLLELQPKTADLVSRQIQINSDVGHAYIEFEHTYQYLERDRDQQLKGALVNLESKIVRRETQFRHAKMAAFAMLLLSIPVYLTVDYHLTDHLNIPMATVIPADTPGMQQDATLPAAESTRSQTAKQVNTAQVLREPSTLANRLQQSVSSSALLTAYQPIVDQKTIARKGNNTGIVTKHSDHSQQDVQQQEIKTPTVGASLKTRQIFEPIPSKEIAYSNHSKDNTISPQAAKSTVMVMEGYLTDGQSGQTIGGAKVRYGNQKIVTKDNGFYQLKLDQSTRQISISKSGYEPEYLKVHPENGIKSLDLAMIASIPSLETKVEVGNKMTKTLGSVALSTEVIKKERMGSNHYTSLEEVLNQVAGISVLDDQVSIREGGLYSFSRGSRVQLIIDGVPVMNADDGIANWDFVPVENVQQVDVLKGAMSTLFGSAALNGAINVRTVAKQPETKISTFGTFYLSPNDKEKKWWGANGADTPYKYGYLFSTAQKFKNLDFALGSALVQDRSFRKGDYNRYLRLNSRVRYHLNQNTELGIGFNTQGGFKSQSEIWENATTGAYKTDETLRLRDTLVRVTVDPYFKIKDQYDNTHQVISSYSFNGVKRSTDTEQFGNNTQQVHNEYQFQRDFTDLELILTAGFNGSFANIISPVYQDTTYRSTNYGGFLEMNKQFFKDRLKFVMGVRYEQNKVFGPGIDALATSAARPFLRVGLNYKLKDRTYLRASWGQGYRYPTISERYLTNSIMGLRVFQNPELEPEEGWTGELGIKQGFAIGNWKGFMDFAAFWQQYTNMIEMRYGRYGSGVDSWGFQAQNLYFTSVQINGMEYSLNAHGYVLGLPVDVSGGYTFSNPRYNSFNQDSVQSSTSINVLKYRHQHNLKFNASTRFKHVTFGVSGNYASHMKAIDSVLENNDKWGLKEYRRTPRNLFSIDARVAYHPNDRLQLSIIGKNLTNRENSLRPGLLQAPINFSLRLSYTI